MPSLLDKDDKLVSGSLLVSTDDPAAGLRPFLIDEFIWCWIDFTTFDETL